MTNDSAPSTSSLPLVIPWAERAVEGGILILIFMVALFGNISLWIVILRSRDLRNKPNYLVLCLSFADILVSAVGMPVTIYTIFYGDWKFSVTTCTATGFINMITFVGSVMSLGVISVNRYIKICRSHQYKRIYTSRNIIIMVAGVWCFSGSLAMPPLIGWGAYDFIPTQSFCFCDWPSSVSYTFFMIGVCFGGPCSVMSFCYVKILKVFRDSRSRINAMSNISATRSSNSNISDITVGENKTNLLDKPPVTSAKVTFLTVPEDDRSKARNKLATIKAQKAARRRQEEFRLSLSLLIVIFVFIVCWFPFCITMFLSVFLPSSIKRGSDMFTILLGYANSGCNPIIYGFMNKRFSMAYRKLFYDIISPCKKRRQEAISDSATLPTPSDVPEATSYSA